MKLTKKDFRVDWFSGRGAGGQHRNKHQNCCRITHIGSGLSAIGTESRSRVANQKKAFTRLARIVVALINPKTGKIRRTNNSEVIRNYHGVRNEVQDKASGLKQSYKHVVIGRNIDGMIRARRMSSEQEKQE